MLPCELKEFLNFGFRHYLKNLKLNKNTLKYNKDFWYTFGPLLLIIFFLYIFDLYDMICIINMCVYVFYSKFRFFFFSWKNVWTLSVRRLVIGMTLELHAIRWLSLIWMFIWINNLVQGSVNDDPRGLNSVLSFLKNKVSLEQSIFFCLHVAMAVFASAITWLSSYDRHHVACKA